MEFTKSLSMDTILSSKNLAEEMTEQEQFALGKKVVETFNMDRSSRAQWEEKMEKANKIALQVAEKKSFPWPGASNVKFPLLTIAALQFHSRAYPALIDTPHVVKCLTLGADQTGKKSEMASRISEHMNWQLVEEDPSWEAEADKSILVQAIMGCCFKKSYFDAQKGHNVSECVLPQDFVISYFSKSVDESPRYTHILSWSNNDMVERMRRGLILEHDLTAPKIGPTPFGLLQAARDESQGLTMTVQDPDQPYVVLEQYLWLDLDGDGYREPYVVTVRFDNQALLRVTPRFFKSGIVYNEKKEISRINPERYFTKIPFIPSPDGGFYDLGFGHLLGPLNESIDTALNQIFDAGTMHNAGGGFLGKGAKIKGGSISLRPNEWVRVDATGDDLRKSIVEAPTREPSAVLFQVLSLLIDYGQRVAGAPDIVQGQNPGQNTPAETSRNMTEQGMKVFSGIYKRTFRAMRDELRLLYRLNQLYLEQTQEFNSLTSGLPMKALAEDYQLPSTVIRPFADPNYMSEGQRQAQASMLMQVASSQPGYDRYKVNQFFLDAYRIPMKDQFFPDPKGPNAVPPPMNPKIQIEQLKQQGKQMEMQLTMKMKLFELLEEHELNQAKIKELEAKAALASAEASTKQTGQVIAAFEAQIGAAKLHQEGRIASINVLKDLIQMMNEKGKEDGTGSMGSMEGAGGDKGVLPSPGADQGGNLGGLG